MTKVVFIFDIIIGWFKKSLSFFCKCVKPFRLFVGFPNSVSGNPAVSKLAVLDIHDIYSFQS